MINMFIFRTFITISTGIVLMMTACTGFTQTRNCKFQFDSTVTIINGQTNASGVRPGDTICLQKGQKFFLLVTYLHGTKLNPIVIQNTDGLVSILESSIYGVKFDSCSYLKFSGAGVDALQYGILVDSPAGVGLSVDGLSTDIEIERVEISNTGQSGIIAKTDPNCQFTSTREKFTLRNLKIHDTFIHDIMYEGMYLGSSKYKGQTISCGSTDTTVLPHLLRGIEIYNNVVQETGWDGIQVSSADSGCYIYDNVILSDSKSEYYYQMSGIMVGGGTQGNIFNNTIKDGKGDGIEVISLGIQKIYNNLIVNAGSTFKPDQNYSPYLKYGIYIGAEYTSPANTNIILFNTIISPKSYGIRFDDTQSTKNFISNNIIVNPGSFPSEGENAYINLGSPSIQITISNNIKTLDIFSVDFVNHSEGNYDLKRSSPAVNSASAIEGFNLNFDLSNRVRPFASFFDIGAFECQDSSLLNVIEYENSEELMLKVFPNPSYSDFNISYVLLKQSEITISIANCEGKNILTKKSGKMLPGKFKFVVRGDFLIPGIYTLSVQSGTISHTAKLIKINH